MPTNHTTETWTAQFLLGPGRHLHTGMGPSFVHSALLTTPLNGKSAEEYMNENAKVISEAQFDAIYSGMGSDMMKHRTFGTSVTPLSSTLVVQTFNLVSGVSRSPAFTPNLFEIRRLIKDQSYTWRCRPPLHNGRGVVSIGVWWNGTLWPHGKMLYV